MGRRLKYLLFSFLIAVILIGIFATIYLLVYENGIKPLNIVLGVLGGKMPLGIIQGIIYTAFVFALFEIWHLTQNIKNEYKGFDLQLLPETEQYVLSPQDVNNIKLAAIQHEAAEKLFVVDLIKKACTKYRSGKSTPEVIGVLDAMIRMNIKRFETEQLMIRFIAESILWIGLIGAVIGIIMGLNHSSSLDESISKRVLIGNVSNDLMLVIYSPTISLLLGLLVKYFYNKLKERGDRFHINAESYILENLVNRLYPE